MSQIEVLLLALALSVDACAVAFTYGLIIKEKRLANALQIASFTGIFQGIMPIAGYFLTSLVKAYVEPFAPYIIFGIFFCLGVKVIKESFAEKKTNVCLGLYCLLIIGIATSIDAFSAGISLSLYGNSIFLPALLIAAVTFLNSAVGFWLGGKLKSLPSKWLEISAGGILIALAVKALL